MITTTRPEPVEGQDRSPARAKEPLTEPGHVTAKTKAKRGLSQSKAMRSSPMTQA